jgi:hypothetical protein
LNSSGKERGEVFCFQRLAKAFIGADSEKLKLRRLPPTEPPRPGKIHLWNLSEKLETIWSAISRPNKPVEFLQVRALALNSDKFRTGSKFSDDRNEALVSYPQNTTR